MSSSYRCVRVCALVALLAVAGSGIAEAGEVLDGFVTKLNSPTDFYLGDRHIVIDANSARCVTEDVGTSFVGWDDDNDFVFEHEYSSLQEYPDAKSRRHISCAKERLSVGSRVRLIVNRTRDGDPLLAEQVTVFEANIRQEFTDVWPDREWMGGALLEEQPKITHAKSGWSGFLWLDGYPMAISRYTTLLTAPPGTEMLYGSCSGSGLPRWCALMPKAPLPSFSASLFQPNTWFTYRGVGPFRGRLLAENRNRVLVQHAGRSATRLRKHVLVTQMRLWSNEIGEKQRRYLAQFTPLIQNPDYVKNIPGSIGFQGQPADKSIKLVPDCTVQEFVSRVGRSLIPEYQNALPIKDRTKIDFRFYVAEGERALGRDQLNQRDGLLLLSQKKLGKGATVFPNGVIVLPDSMLAKMENEAQLAALLSDAIASVLQNQAFLARTSNDTSSSVEANRWEAPLSLYLLMNEQAIRIGIRQMYLAGYDIREAPFAWAVAAGRPAMNPVTAPDRISANVPWHAAYAFDYIRQFYSGADYGKLRRGEKEYAKFLGRLREVDPEAFAGKE